MQVSEDHLVHWHFRRAAAVNGEDVDVACHPSGVDGVGKSGGSAGKLATVVHAPSVGGSENACDDIVVFSKHQISAEFFGQGHSVRVVPIDGNDLACAHGFGSVHCKQTDGTEAVNGHGCTLNRATRQRVDGVAERVLNRSMTRVKTLGDVASVRRRDHEIRSEGAVTVNAKD